MCSDYYQKTRDEFLSFKHTHTAYPNLLLTVIPPYHEKNYSNDLRSFDSY